MKYKTLGILFICIISVLLVAGCSQQVDNNENSNNENNKSLAWIEDYTPAHSLGSDENSFWIDHPIDGSISHPQWVIDSLESNCVVFVVHKHTCTWCDPQAQRVIALSEEYEDSMYFYDLDLDLGGDIMEKGYDSLIYDPDGPPSYIALTGIITLIKDDGETHVAWHAWEGDMTESELEDWMKDAMYYYHINKDDI
jgi:ABC-type Fe3+-hydroxamate transport system substrate-binding protein